MKLSKAKNMFKGIVRKIKSCIFYKLNNSNNIVRNIKGCDNKLFIGKNFCCGILHVIMHGNNNSVEIGSDCRFNGENWIFMSGDNNHLVIGNHVTFDDDVHFIQAEGTNISVGNDCMFAKHINIRTSDQHGIYDGKNQRVNIAKSVSIGEHVWIGASVLVMKGVDIGSGSVIGIQSMVTKDVPNNCIAVGQPAKIIKENMHWTRAL